MPEYRFVRRLPDLIAPWEYAADPGGTKVRVRIRTTAQGIEVLGDSLRPEAVEGLLEALGAQTLEQMLCG